MSRRKLLAEITAVPPDSDWPDDDIATLRAALANPNQLFLQLIVWNLQALRRSTPAPVGGISRVNPANATGAKDRGLRRKPFDFDLL
jgi:hypothetical protein